MANFNDTFMYTLVITLFGMGIVFIVLVALQYILKSMKLFFYKEKKEGADVTQVPETNAAAAVVPQAAVSEAADNDELVAVITAAVVSCLGGRSNIIVRNIRRVDDLTPVWGKASRTEQMANRF